MTTENIEQFWRPATKADVVRLMDGEEVQARFRDKDSCEWVTDFALGGWLKDDQHWIDAEGIFWTFCQVYDPPQWWLDRPEPGDEYRLLGKFPDEDLQGGDFIHASGTAWAELANGCKPGQLEGVWYRRRIEQPKSEPKLAVGQRVKIIGGISGPYIGIPAVIEAMTIESTGWFYELRNIEGLFHETNLEAVVEPEPKHYTLRVGDTISVPSGHQIIVTESGIKVQ